MEEKFFGNVSYHEYGRSLVSDAKTLRENGQNFFLFSRPILSDMSVVKTRKGLIRAVEKSTDFEKKVFPITLKF